MNIVTAHETLAVEGLNSEHDSIIETVLSKLFFRSDRVHKAYKHRKADFADLSDITERRIYIKEDFSWNRIMAPEVYLELRHVALNDNLFIHVEEAHAEDWYIVMKKIDTNNDLLKKLTEKTFDTGKLLTYPAILEERLKELTEQKSGELRTYFEKGAEHLQNELLGVLDWAYTAEPFISTEEIKNIEKLFHQIFMHEYFQKNTQLSVVIDTNPENIIFHDDSISFIDVMPPKSAWRVHDKYFLLCRTSADVGALHDEREADWLHLVYQKHNLLPPKIIRIAYEIAACLIQVPYRKMLGSNELAQQYAKFLKKRVGELEHLLATQEN